MFIEPEAGASGALDTIFDNGVNGGGKYCRVVKDWQFSADNI
jgi:hypothetical protein